MTTAMGIRWGLLSIGTNNCDGCGWPTRYVMRFYSPVLHTEFYLCADCLTEVARELERLDGR